MKQYAIATDTDYVFQYVLQYNATVQCSIKIALSYSNTPIRLHVVLPGIFFKKWANFRIGHTVDSFGNQL